MTACVQCQRGMHLACLRRACDCHGALCGTPPVIALAVVKEATR